jgi:hypothetical protein
MDIDETRYLAQQHVAPVDLIGDVAADDRPGYNGVVGVLEIRQQRSELTGGFGEIGVGLLAHLRNETSGLLQRACDTGRHGHDIPQKRLVARIGGRGVEGLLHRGQHGRRTDAEIRIIDGTGEPLEPGCHARKFAMLGGVGENALEQPCRDGIADHAQTDTDLRTDRVCVFARGVGVVDVRDVTRNQRGLR